MKNVIGPKTIKHFLAKLSVNDIEGIDFQAPTDMPDVDIGFAGKRRTANDISLPEKFLGQPGTGKTANTGNIGFNVSSPRGV